MKGTLREGSLPPVHTHVHTATQHVPTDHTPYTTHIPIPHVRHISITHATHNIIQTTHNTHHIQCTCNTYYRPAHRTLTQRTTHAARIYTTHHTQHAHTSTQNTQYMPHTKHTKHKHAYTTVQYRPHGPCVHTPHTRNLCHTMIHTLMCMHTTPFLLLLHAAR